MKIIENAEMNEMLSKYGWRRDEEKIFNRNGKHVVTIEGTSSKYKLLDSGGNKLMTGRGQIVVSLEKLMKEYYYCIPVSEIGNKMFSDFKM